MSSACTRGGAAESSLDEIEANDSLPQAVKTLVKAVVENDSVGFANLMSYPIQRPYPLHDVENSEEMRSYYPKLVDDSLRQAISHSRPDEWQRQGWRGWSVKNGEYVWVDESVYDVPYLSRREKSTRDSLMKCEMESLAPSMRDGGWIPEGCYSHKGGNQIYRIDRRDEKEGQVYRLAVYPDHQHMGQDPEHILRGHQEADGTAVMVTYFFDGDDGSKAEFTPAPDDDSVPTIYFTTPDGKETPIEVKAEYWLDILGK